MRNFRPLPWQAENLKHQRGAPTAVAAAVAHLTAPDVRHVRVNDILSCMFYPNRWLQNGKGPFLGYRTCECEIPYGKTGAK